MTLTKKQIRALRRNTTPFGLLSKEMKDAFRANEGPIEYYSFSGEKWRFTEEPVWGNQYIYRLATLAESALIPDVVPWGDIAPGWDYFARDENGYPKVAKIPFIKDYDVFVAGDGSTVHIAAFANYRIGTTDWKDSLQIRPGVM